ncbi:MAG: HAD family hydrolase [SAR202 cluster bacterium]|nr:HAD family hydrolase [SAR202 cluster bacterium]
MTTQRLKLKEAKWLFFDLGNTLLNEQKMLRDYVNQIGARFLDMGVMVSESKVEAAMRASAEKFTPGIAQGAIELLTSDEKIRAYVYRGVKYKIDLVEAYPEAKDVLSKLSTHYHLGIVANQHAGNEEHIARWGIGQFFKVIVISSQSGLKKPDAAVFSRAIELAETKAADAVMIGDRIDEDIRPAKQLGWKTVRVTQGIASVQKPREPMDYPDATVSNLAQVVELFI